ncbi:MAG: hypothetical protein AAF126_15820 [Chloroflexota bacterium]
MRLFRAIQIILFVLIVLMAPAIFADYMPVEGEIHYQLNWELGDAELTADGLQVTNDLGYSIVIHEGYVSSYNATMNACEHSHGLFEWLWEQLTPSVAQAGHGEDDDPAMIDTTVVESFTALESAYVGSVTVEEPAYCEGFYLIGSAHYLAQSLPEDFDMLGYSLYLRGRYTTPEGITLPFSLLTDTGWGTLSDLVVPSTEALTHVEVSGDPITISIQRNAETMFDGITFDTLNETDLSRAILRNLTESTQFIVLSGKMH